MNKEIYINHIKFFLEKRKENMEVNKERIISLIGEIEKSVSVLNEFGLRDKADLLDDLKSPGSVKYFFITAIEA